ncbi:MAG: EAL domain-containing protein [Ruminiclostridium sp.]|nr:EAL domain-containing protein [Ruminiclostridium sp.]MBQ8825939.1 EAL domain-containing protein [Oscillospiraceae bacterium]
MDKLIQFDLCALILLIVLLFSTILRKMTHGSSNAMFLCILSTMLLSVGFNIWAVLLDNSGTAGAASLYAAHTGYLLFHNLTTPMYVLYVISLADTWHKLKKSLVQKIMLVAPYTFLFMLLIYNLFTGSVFSVSNHEYHRADLFFLLYIIAAYYMVLGLVYLYIYRKYLTTLKIISISAMAPMMIIAIIIQYFCPAFVVEMFTGALSLLIVTMTTQRPEEIIDARTGLGNYNAYADNVKRSFATGKSFSIIMLNIGNFASIQSMLTYDSTVAFLRTIAQEIENTSRYHRIHADAYYLDRGRFRIVVERSYSDKINAAASMLLTALKSNISINNLSIDAIPHICIVNCPEDVKDFTTLTSFGGNFHERKRESDRVIMASELFGQEKFNMANNIDIIIERAIANHKFKVYYQPIYSVEKGKFSTAEALLRLIDDEYGFVPPDMFIPAAEKSGAIHKIGDFVLDDVCRFIASDEFKKLGLDYIEINLSVAQCMHGDLADKVLKTLDKYNLSTDKINLEITETAVSFGQNAMRNNLDKLSEAGVSFSLDDYGTGYSNMKRVVQLPLKIVKLDKSFVDEQNNPKMWIVLQNTVKMLKDMNMEIVVEGIETEKMVEQFTELNCDYIQGYYYSKPIPEEQFVEFICKAHDVAV